MSKSNWSKEDDQKLLTLLEEHNYDFKKVNSFFPGRTLIAIRSRFPRIDPRVRSGKWEKDEDKRLLEWTFNTCFDMVNSSLSLFDNRKLSDVKGRLECFRVILHEQLFPGIKLERRKYKLLNNIVVKKSKRVMKDESKRVKVKEDMFNRDGDEDEDEGSNYSEPDYKPKAIKKAKQLVSQVKSEVSNFTDKTSQETSSTLQSIVESMKNVDSKLTIGQFMSLTNLELPNEKSWSNSENIQLFELHKVLKCNWAAMEKLMQVKMI